MLISELAPFNIGVLNQYLLNFQELLANPNLAEIEIKHHLAGVVKNIVSSSFAWSSVHQLLSILRWGVDKKRLKAEGSSITAHKDIVELLVQQLHGRITIETLAQAKISLDRFDSAIEMLANLPTIEQSVIYFKTISENFRNVVV